MVREVRRMLLHTTYHPRCWRLSPSCPTQTHRHRVFHATRVREAGCIENNKIKWPSLSKKVLAHQLCSMNRRITTITIICDTRGSLSVADSAFQRPRFSIFFSSLADSAKEKKKKKRKRRALDSLAMGLSAPKKYKCLIAFEIHVI